MVDSSLDFVRTDHKGLTLRITVLPFSSIREDCPLYPVVYYINAGDEGEGSAGMCGEWEWGQV